MLRNTTNKQKKFSVLSATVVFPWRNSTNAPRAASSMSVGTVVGTFALKNSGGAKSVDTDTAE